MRTSGSSRPGCLWTYSNRSPPPTYLTGAPPGTRTNSESSGFSEPEKFQQFAKFSTMSRLRKNPSSTGSGEALHDDERSTARRNHLMHLHLIYGADSGPFQQSCRTQTLLVGLPYVLSDPEQCVWHSSNRTMYMRACVPACLNARATPCVRAWVRRCETPCVSEASGMSRSKATSSP